MVKPRLLLSACCGPCSTVALERLQNDYDITVFFWGSNLDTQNEYEKRLTALKTVNSALNYNKPLIIAEYNNKDFFTAAANLLNGQEGGIRCKKCFELRLKATAETAKSNKFDLFATTLTTSPHKDAETINKIGERIAAEYGIKYLPTDFRRNGGFNRSAELSKQLGIYRQKYCGCRQY